MRILIIHNFYQDPGGEDIVFAQEVEALKEHNEVYTLTFKNQKGWQGLIQFFSSPWNIAAANRVEKKIQEIKPDVVHIHNTQYGCGPLIIRRIAKLGIPLLMTVHNFRLLCPSASLFFEHKLFMDSVTKDFPWSAIRYGVLDHSKLKTAWLSISYWLHRKVGTWNLVDRYLVLSAFAKNLFSESSFPVPTAKFTIKANFVEALPKMSVKPSQRFLYIGRLSSEKGILPLVSALKNTSFEFLIAGQGPELDAVKQEIKDAPNIQLLGQLNKVEIAQQLQEATALIVPSVCLEGMPLTVLEAFSVGKPVLASNLGVLQELVQVDKTGDLFDVSNAQDIQECCQRWIEKSDAERRSIAENCQAAFANKYSKERSISTLMQAYTELIQSKKEFVSLHK